MRAFAEGAKSAGARVFIGDMDRKLVDARLAVILGWVGMNFSGPHIYFRRDIIEHQKMTGGRVMPIDGSCFKFSNDNNLYLRYSLDSVFYNQGEYANLNSDDTKWQEIRDVLGLKLQPWREKGNHILVCLQRDSGWNAKGFDQTAWLQKTCKIIRSQTEKPIIVRPHPANKIDWTAVTSKFSKCTVSGSANRLLEQDIKNAHAAVFYNSSSSVAAVLAGIPAFVTDDSAVTWSVANHSTRDINDPQYPSREQWLYDFSACHWREDESIKGNIYRHFEPYLPPK